MDIQRENGKWKSSFSTSRNYNKLQVEQMRIVLIFLFLLSSLFSEKKPTLSMRTYKKLTNIETLVKKKETANAEKSLEKLLNNLPESSIDRAYIFNTAGTFYLNRENYSKATEQFIEAYYEYSLSTKENTALLKLIGNLYMQEDEYKKALNFYELYLRRVYKPEKNIINTMAVAYYQLGLQEKVISLIEKYKSFYKPDENMYQMLFSAYYELEKFKHALKTSIVMVKNWNEKREYWLQKASLYYQFRNSKKALETMELAYNNGVLKTETDHLQYIYLLLEEKIPFKAGELLEKFIKEKRVKNSKKNRELLKSCRLYSR
jgi:tetratricopeptide (TPR) repeat protein